MEHVPTMQAGVHADYGRNLPSVGAQVSDADQQRAQVVSVKQAEPEPSVLLRTVHGKEIIVPVSLLQPQQDGSYSLSVAFDALVGASTTPQQQTVIPVTREELQVDKRTVETGRGVRIHKTVHEQEQIVDQPLLQDELAVEHVPVGTMVEAGQQPTMRHEGDTLVVPVFEEVLVVEKRLRLKEEIRITRRSREVHTPQRVTLKSEQIAIERFDDSLSASSSGETNRIAPSPGSEESHPGKSAE
jgi:uncharacterized protein (TIGR02271 family)